MSDEAHRNGSDSEDDFLTRDEFEKLWESARQRSEPARAELFVYPVLLLYTGFFFGPFMTAIVALAVLRGRMHFRHAGFVFGVAGVAWCLIQGLTAYNAAVWSTFALQFTRSSINFAAGALTYAVIRREAIERYSPSRNTLHRTIGAVIVLIALFFVISSEMAITLGR